MAYPGIVLPVAAMPYALYYMGDGSKTSPRQVGGDININTHILYQVWHMEVPPPPFFILFFTAYSLWYTWSLYYNYTLVYFFSIRVLNTQHIYQYRFRLVVYIVLCINTKYESETESVQ